MRSVVVTLALAFASLIAVPAFAAPGAPPAGAHRADGAGGDKAKHFPMPAAEFKQKVDARTAKGRARMEERAAKLSAEEAKALRARFEAGVAKVNAEVAKAIADGTVTKEEALAVRAARPHHGKHARHGKGHGAKKR